MSVERRAMAVLRDEFPPAVVLPDLRQWRLRALVAASACRAGRSHLAHRFQAWTALPGDEWYDMPRMVRGRVLRVPRPGTAIMLCAAAETLHVFPDALDDPDTEVTTRDRALRGMVYRPAMRQPQVPRLWLETVRVRDWSAWS